MVKNKKNKKERERKEERREAAAASASSRSTSNNVSSNTPSSNTGSSGGNKKKRGQKGPIIMTLGNILYITYFVCIILIINYFAVTYINYSNVIDFTKVTGPIAFLDYIFYLLKSKDKPKQGEPETKNEEKPPDPPVGFIIDKVLYNSTNFFKEICSNDFITFLTNYVQIGINIILYSFVYFWYIAFNFNKMTDTSTIVKLCMFFLMLFIVVYICVYLNIIQIEHPKKYNAGYDFLNALYSVFICLLVLIFGVSIPLFLYLLYKSMINLPIFGTLFGIILLLLSITLITLSIYAYTSSDNFLDSWFKDIDGYTISLIIISLILYFPLWISPIIIIIYLIMWNISLLLEGGNSKQLYPNKIADLIKNSKGFLFTLFFIVPLFVLSIYFLTNSINLFNI